MVWLQIRSFVALLELFYSAFMAILIRGIISRNFCILKEGVTRKGRCRSKGELFTPPPVFLIKRSAISY